MPASVVMVTMQLLLKLCRRCERLLLLLTGEVLLSDMSHTLMSSTVVWLNGTGIN